MQKIFFLIVILIALFAISCRDYYKEPMPMQTKTNLDATLFNMQIPNIFNAMNYEIEEINEAEMFAKAFKYIDYKGNDVKLYFQVNLENSDVILVTFIQKDKNYYLDKDRYPDEIREVYITDVEIFLARIKGGSYPNRP